MRLLIAGGGTGGHLYPGLAVAEEARRRGAEILFVGTSRGLEARVVPAAGYPLELLQVSGLNRVSAAAFLRGLGRLPLAFVRSIAILRRFRPDVVLGVGGYASGPIVASAALLRIPTAIQEQNSVPGFTNRQLGRVVRAVFAGFAEAGQAFRPAKVRVTGNPVRRGLCEAASGTAAVTGATASGPGHGAAPASPESAPRAGRVLAVGGSQGARAVNDLVIGAARLLAARDHLPPLVHQTGAADEARCREAYGSLVGRVTVAPFIDDMAATYAAADLVIGRAGALTLAELAVLGRPAILIPLPTAADDHQRKNAEAFAAAGAAVVLPQAEATAERLADLIDSTLSDRHRLGAMASAMRALGRPEAARTIVDQLLDLVKT